MKAGEADAKPDQRAEIPSQLREVIEERAPREEQAQSNRPVVDFHYIGRQNFPCRELLRRAVAFWPPKTAINISTKEIASLSALMSQTSLCFTSRHPKYLVPASSGLPESCPKIGDVPKSPVPLIGSPGAVGRHNDASTKDLVREQVPMNARASSIAHGSLRLIAGQGNSSATMTVPHYISESQSDMRGIKHGWYAIEDDGKLSSGPFPSFEECLTEISQLANGTLAPNLQQGPN